MSRVTSSSATGSSAISGPVTVVQPTGFNLHVDVDNFPALQPVSGTVTALQGTTPWVVSGSGTFTVVQPTGSSLHVDVDNFPSFPTLQAVNLTEVGGTAFTLGQQLTSLSLPVVTQPDLQPATQTITTQDVSSTTTTYANGQNFITGTPTAGSAASFPLTSYESTEIQVTGTWTGTLQTEVSIDNGTTWFTRGVKQSGAAYLSSSFTNNFEGGMNVAGFTNVRVRATAAMTGTATVRIVATIHESSIIVSNPLTLRDSVTQSISNTIKAASTASTALDTSLVVALSPNSSLPTGTNNLGSVVVSSVTTGPFPASSTSTVTRVTSSATSVTLAASNTSRKAIYFYNDSTHIAYVILSSSAATSTTYTIQMQSLSFATIDLDPVYTGQINAIWTAADFGGIVVTELS